MRFTLTSYLTIAAVGAAVAATSPAAAQSASDKAQAEALFQAGKDLMSAGKFGEACAKLEASQRLDAGVGTLLYLADCYEKAGKLASSWATFREAESVAMQKSEQSRASVAKKRAAALEPRLSKLAVKMASGNPADTRVLQNGTMVPKESWGLPLPVDAGQVSLEASAKGRKPWSTTITVQGEGTSASVDVPVLEEAPVEAAPPPPATATTPAPAPKPERPPEAPPSSGQRTAGLIVAGAGIVGVGIGSFFGLRAKSKNDDSKDHCASGDPNRCSQAGVDLRDQARTAATLSTVFMVGGGALLAGGIVLFLTAPSAQTREVSTLQIGAQVGPGDGRLTVGGAF